MKKSDLLAEHDIARDEKVDRIVEIAQARFDHFGYNKTTMEEISRDAGVSKKTIYEYLPGKDQGVWGQVSLSWSRVFGLILSPQPERGDRELHFVDIGK